MLSTPHLTPSWSSARSRKAQGLSVALDTPTVEERAWAQGPRFAQEHIDLRSMLGQFLCHALRKAPSLRNALREKGQRSRGSAEGWLRVNRAVLIGCQVSAHEHALRRLTRRLPCLPGPDNPELFHAKGQRRTVQAQADRCPLGAREHPLGLLQRRQDECPFVLFQRLGLSTLVARDDRGTQVVEGDL